MSRAWKIISPQPQRREIAFHYRSRRRYRKCSHHISCIAYSLRRRWFCRSEICIGRGRMILARSLRVIKWSLIKSTVPVGTAERCKSSYSARIIKVNFDVVSNPEFLREGVAVDDFMKPDRVVIGTEFRKITQADGRSATLHLCARAIPWYLWMNASAELTKYAANSFLATKISFMNEIARLCEMIGADVDMVRRGIGSDNRIGKRFLFPGIGYGGSCFPKDVQALVRSSNDVNYEFQDIECGDGCERGTDNCT